MKKLLIWAMMLTSIIYVSCAKSEEGDEDKLGSIYGIVTELGTAEPMKAVGVELYKKDLNSRYYDYDLHDWTYKYTLLLKTVTFDDGHFEFKDLNPENYQVKVVADGYEQTEEGYVTVEAGRQARIDLQVKKQDIHAKAYTANATVSGNQVTLNGEYTKDYNYSVTEAGFVYATNNNPQNGGTMVKCKKDEIEEVNYAYKFSITISNLPRGTYYYQAYATTGYGTAYGEILSFNMSGNPVVSTLAASNITETTATLNGHIDYNGDPAYTERGFVYSYSYATPTVEDPESATTKKKVSGSSEDFSANVAGLTKNKTYYVRAYVSNSQGTWYGESISFSTDLSAYVVIDGLAVQKQDLGYASWSAGKAMCEASRVGGFSDWRLPTIAELAMIYTHKDKIGGFKNEGYWSSSGTTNDHYYYNFSSGLQKHDYYDPKQFYIRAVRTVK